VLPRRFRSSAPWAPAVRVGLPPIIVLALRNRASHIVTPVTPTGDHGGTSYPQMIRIKSDEASAWGMTLNTPQPSRRRRAHCHLTAQLLNASFRKIVGHMPILTRATTPPSPQPQTPHPESTPTPASPADRHRRYKKKAQEENQEGGDATGTTLAKELGRRIGVEVDPAVGVGGTWRSAGSRWRRTAAPGARGRR
jgi:hypothetical protein